jgi:hypothetical protein
MLPPPAPPFEKAASASEPFPARGTSRATEAKVPASLQSATSDPKREGPFHLDHDVTAELMF